MPDNEVDALPMTRCGIFGQYRGAGKILASANSDRISEYIAALKGSRRLGRQVTFYHYQPGIPSRYDSSGLSILDEISRILDRYGIRRLYSHQAKAIGLIKSGKDVVVATPTASGKTLIYNVPVVEQVLNRPESRALYLFPLKALAQDQLKIFRRFVAGLDDGVPDAEIYDGDTSSWRRKKIRERPPNVLLTNPEMLHLSLLAYHDRWCHLWRNLTHIVVDEVHSYRGIMGSNMAWVFRRLKRICRYYGSHPVFVMCSATIGNPGELATELIGRQVIEVNESGAPRGGRHILFIDPEDMGAAQVAIDLLLAALHRGLKTIVYTQSRKLTELIGLWTSQRAGRYVDKIAVYRAGFLPEERREIEGRMSSGQLLAVVSTSALELGIDIGSLDLCILVGYPGTIMSTWQRGGRVGRSMKDSAIILLPQEDALDQFFLRNPRELLIRPPEAAVINKDNPAVAEGHILCAASELPIDTNGVFLDGSGIKGLASSLERRGKLLMAEDGSRLFANTTGMHRRVNLRGAGPSFRIISEVDSSTIGVIDGFRAYRETHPGAIYLHRGKTYVVKALEQEKARVLVRPAKVGYFTRVTGHKDTEILDVYDDRKVCRTRFSWGRLRIKDQVTGFERRQVRGQRLINRVDLDLPPQIFETEGLWWQIPSWLQTAVEDARLHFMGGIHAVEHAAIGILPLLVLTDRNDFGGISTPFHAQVPGPAVFVYDGIPGGVGLSRQAFIQAKELIEQTLKAVETCPCELGCPSCVHSPKCGSGNRPIDKEAALLILRGLAGMDISTRRRPGAISGAHVPVSAAGDSVSPIVVREAMERRQRAVVPVIGDKARGAGKPRVFRGSVTRFGVLDIETQLSAHEVGGWHRADLMKVSCAVLYDSKKDDFFAFEEDQLGAFFDIVRRMDLIIGFNIKRFDYKVLTAYSDMDFWALPTLDILEVVHKRLGYRLSLDALAKATLGAEKSANGLQALRWWKQGKIKKIIDYCRKDVMLTRDLFLFGREQGYLLFDNKAGNRVRLPVEW